MKYLITIAFFFFLPWLSAQEIGLDTNQVSITDSVSPLIKSPTVKIRKERNPKKAALLSMLLPGAGQIYNRKIWKAPIVYAGIGTAIYFIDNNRDIYRCLRDAYIIRLEGVEEDKYIGRISSLEGIQNVRDEWRKNMELAYFATAAVYILQIVEAYIDAHLQSFDVNEDLTLHFTPIYRDPTDIVRGKVGLFLQL